VPYQLASLTEMCAELELEHHWVNENELEIRFSPECILLFQNMPDEKDTAFGFKDTPWHAHESLRFMTGEDTYVDLDELEIVLGIAVGDILIVSRYVSGKLEDRWLTHKKEKLDLKYMFPEEELRVLRLG
jgi:hypothetical protein